MSEQLSTADALDIDRFPLPVPPRGASPAFGVVAVSQPALLGDQHEDAWTGAAPTWPVQYENTYLAIMQPISQLLFPDERCPTWSWNISSETGALIGKRAYAPFLTELFRVAKVASVQDMLQGLGYAVRKPSQVTSLLLRDPYLTGIVAEAPSRILRCFPRAGLILEVRNDPEVTRQQLLIFIRTDLPPDDALDSLELLEDDWWLAVLPEVAGRLCINLEFQ